MKRVSRWISAHPVPSFFVLAYLLAWPLLALAIVVFPQNMASQGTFGSLAVFAPAFAAMIVGSIAEPRRLAKRRTAHWATFVATWLLAATTLVLFASRLRGAPIGPPVIGFGLVLGTLPAFVASRAFSRVEGIRRHFRSLVVPRGNALWYLVALGAFPAIQLAGVGITRVIGGDSASGELAVSVDPSVAVLLFLHGFFFAGGVNEESGWRGFALPRLQRRFSPLVAALIVWVFWAAWHLPVDLASGDAAAAVLTNRLFLNAMWSILFMWVYNRTRGSLLAPALFHPAMNASGALLPRTDAATILFAALVAAAILVDRMWRRLPGSRGGLAGGDLGGH